MLIEEAPPSEARDAAYDVDREADGYVWNYTRAWGWRPEFLEGFKSLRASLMGESSLTDRDWAVLVAATASQLGDSYCSLAWGAKLAKLTDEATAAGVVGGDAAPGLTERERALEAWARQLVQDPNATTADDVEALRGAGLGEREIFEATAFAALRLAFSTINDALGVEPDRQLAEAAPAPVREAVSFGRPPGAAPSAA